MNKSYKVISSTTRPWVVYKTIGLYVHIKKRIKWVTGFYILLIYLIRIYWNYFILNILKLHIDMTIIYTDTMYLQIVMSVLYYLCPVCMEELVSTLLEDTTVSVLTEELAHIVVMVGIEPLSIFFFKYFNFIFICLLNNWVLCTNKKKV
jgi:hypothetical protein